MLDRIRNGRTDLVLAWLSSGNTIRAGDANDVSLLQWCAYYGDVSAIRFLVEQGEDLMSLGDNLDLNGAAFHGHWQLCEFLVEQGADPSHPFGEARETPLHVALSKANRVRSDRVVQVLLSAGADPNAATLAGAETGCFMRDARARGETPLHRAAAFGSDAAIHALIEAGADREARDAHGDTPLSWASWHLRPAAILRQLCFDGFAIHPDADWPGDHGQGASAMDVHLAGTPIGGGA